jgi:mono/diheme cytochrome c family protein
MPVAHRLIRVMTVTVFAVISLPAFGQGHSVGGSLAERWCMACHNIERAPPAAVINGVPSFVAIVAKPTTTAESLDRYLSTGHTRMPDFSLSPSERQALVSYILSLR